MSSATSASESKPKYASILMDPNRVIFGDLYLEDPQHPATRALPGVAASPYGPYMPTDIRRNLRWALKEGRMVCVPRYESDEEGWISYPSQRVIKKRARAAERRKEREGWMGSLTEPVSMTVTDLPPL